MAVPSLRRRRARILLARITDFARCSGELGDHGGDGRHGSADAGRGSGGLRIFAKGMRRKKKLYNSVNHL